MAERSMLWTTNGTGHGVVSGYAADRWQAFIRKLFLSDQAANGGVLLNVDNNLAVSGTASPLSLATGAAIDYAFMYENDAPLNLAVTTPTVGTTGGRVVLRANWAAQTVTAFAVRNTDGVAAIPALTQIANTTWEISLATFTITTGGAITLTDTRGFANFSTQVTTAMLKDLSVTTAKLALLAVNTAQLAADAVDDTKVGARVPQFYRRQGGSATDWFNVGNTNQTPTTVRIQAGHKAITAGAQPLTVTFPQAFSAKPLVWLQVYGNANLASSVNGTTTTTATVEVRDPVAGVAATTEFGWLAIGPE